MIYVFGCGVNKITNFESGESQESPILLLKSNENGQVLTIAVSIEDLDLLLGLEKRTPALPDIGESVESKQDDEYLIGLGAE